MKKMMLLMLVFCLGITASMNAQVKIGEGDLAPGAVLDLTNPENLGLLLPQVLSLPASGELCKLGMMVYCNNRIYTYNGSAWIGGATATDVAGLVVAANLKKVNGEELIGTGDIIVGATGPQGPQGPDGDPGTPGAKGPDGDTGAVGPVGPTPPLATQSANGLMSAADKIKLDGL